MPLTLLDIGLLVVMLISGILAMVRGFMREILSIAAWVIAAGVTLYGYARAETYVKQYVTNDLVAKGIAIGGLFLLTLLIVSILTVKISDLVLDSRVGALDRSLGFLFGLPPGLAPRVAEERPLPRGAAGHRRLAALGLAGRPGDRHLETVKEAAGRGTAGAAAGTAARQERLAHLEFAASRRYAGRVRIQAERPARIRAVARKHTRSALTGEWE